MQINSNRNSRNDEAQIIAPSYPQSLEIMGCKFCFRIENDCLFWEISHDKYTPPNKLPALFIAQGREEKEAFSKTIEDRVVYSGSRPCKHILCVEIKDPMNYQVLYNAYAGPSKNGMDSFLDFNFNREKA